MPHDERKQADDEAKGGLPTPAESWRRETEILELVNRIRAARERRTPDSPAPRR